MRLSREMIEAGARALFEDPLVRAEYSWAAMAVEDKSRADIWRDDARRVLTAALAVQSDSQSETSYHSAAPTRDAADAWTIPVERIEAAHKAYHDENNTGWYFKMRCAIAAALAAHASAERPSDRQCPHMPEGVEKRAGACHRCAVEAGWTGAPAVAAPAEPRPMLTATDVWKIAKAEHDYHCDSDNVPAFVESLTYSLRVAGIAFEEQEFIEGGYIGPRASAEPGRERAADKLAPKRPKPEPSEDEWHIGRSFQGTRLEDACPCEKAPCGLVTHEAAEKANCPEHRIDSAKTIRQAHLASKCPAIASEPSEEEREHGHECRVPKSCDCEPDEDEPNEDGLTEADFEASSLYSRGSKPTRDAELIAEAKAADVWRVRNNSEYVFRLISRLVAELEGREK